MFKDPVVEEVRATRHKHASKFNYDLKKIAEDMNKRQEESWKKECILPAEASKT